MSTTLVLRRWPVAWPSRRPAAVRAASGAVATPRVCVQGCLQHDPNKRWTATQLQAALLSDAVDTLDLA